MGMKDIMLKVKDGLGLKKRQQMGPLGCAVEHLNAFLQEMVDKGHFEKSLTAKSVHVLLDHCRKSREALEAAADLVSYVEKPGAEVMTLAQKVSVFKAKAVVARLSQPVPFKDAFPSKGQA